MGFSPTNSEMLLFAFDVKNVWRHSFTARYVVFDSVKNESYNLVAKDGSEHLQYCDWVDNVDGDETLLYVSNNNIYIREHADLEDYDIAITNDGQVDNVFNGIPDWVYEEEVLGVNFAHVTNGGKLIAFAQFNDTLVPDFRYPHYGDPHDVPHSQYPEYR